MENKVFQNGYAIQAFQIPAATGGNGGLTYAQSGLPAGLVFDADGSGSCAGATPRTVCGTPSTDTAAPVTVTITVSDADGSTGSADEDTLTFTVDVVTPSAAITAPASLAEATLSGGDGTWVTVTLTDATFESNVYSDSFTLTTNPGLRGMLQLRVVLAVVSAGDRSARVLLRSNSSFNDAYTVALTVEDSAHSLRGALTTPTINMVPTPSVELEQTRVWVTEGSGAGAYQVYLGGQPTGTVTVTATTNDANAATADTSTDSGIQTTLSFTPSNWNTSQRVFVAAVDDDDFMDETVTISHSATDYGVSSGPDLTVTVSDDENAGFVFDADPSTTTVDDAGPLALQEDSTHTDNSASYSVRLAAPPTGTVTVTITSQDAAAATVDTDANMMGAQSTLSFTTSNWATARTVTLTAVQDDDLNSETVAIRHAATGGGYNGVQADFQATVADDDAGVIVDTDPNVAGDQGTPIALREGQTRTYTVRLSIQPSGGNVTVAVSSDNNEIGVTPNSLSFTTGNWSTARTVTVRGNSDGDAVGEWGDITNTANGGQYSNVATTIRATVEDDEATGTDYDTDGDFLIEISTLAQLNAVRWDLDGDGTASTGNESSYATAFTGSDADEDMGCLDGPDSNQDGDCKGYELLNDLDFDTDGDGATHTNGVSDSGDAYHNGGDGWLPIGPGPDTAPAANTHFRALFDGNGRVIDNLYLNRNRNHSGLFAGLSDAAHVTSLGLPDARVQQGQSAVGALAGASRGRVSAVWVSGSVRAVGGNLGGLIGSAASPSAIVASYSAAAVECTGSGARDTGGLVGANDSGASIAASYSRGAVSGACTSKGGLAVNSGTVTASYWDTDLANIADDANSDPPEGLSTANMQTPTSYTQTVTIGSTPTAIYGDWDDQDVDGDGATADGDDADPWDFGLPNQHPMLKYRGLKAAPQLSAQPVPDFGSATVESKVFQNGYAIQAFQIPAATGGNGGLTYVQSGLPAGLVFDADGSGSCAGNAPRTVCGTPSADTAAPVTVTITVSDADGTTGSADEDTLTFTVDVVTPSAAITAPTSLAEATLIGVGGAWVTVALTDATFKSGVLPNSSFTLTTNPGLGGAFRLWVAAVALVSAGDRSARLFMGSRGSSDRVYTLAVTVEDSAHSLRGALTTAPINIVPTPSVILSRTRLPVGEGGAANSYRVRLGGQPTGPVTVTATTSDANVATADTSTASGIQTTLSFTTSNWNTPQTVLVAAVEDDDALDETVTIGHSAPDYGVSSGPDLTVSVHDDETAGLIFDADPSTTAVDDAGPLALQEDSAHADNSASYSVRLASQPTGTVTVTITSQDAAAVTVGDTDANMQGTQNTLNFTTLNWSTAQTVTLTAVADDEANSETVAIRHVAGNGGYDSVRADFMATVVDDDTQGLTIDAATLTASGVAEGSAGTYTVRLATQPTGPVAVTIGNGDAGAVSADGDAGLAGDQGTLLFHAANWNTAQTVTVTALEDDDGGDESVTLTHSASGADYGEVADAEVRFAVTDDDAKGATLSTTSLRVQENGTATYTVALNTEPVDGSVSVAVASDTPADATASPSSLTFTAGNWDTPQTVTVTGVDDPGSTVGGANVGHTPTGADYGGVSIGSVTVIVGDDEQAGVTVSPVSLSVPEGSSATYTVRLSTAPTGTVTVTVTVGGATSKLTADADPGTDGDQTALTFDATNWATAQTVTVSAAADADGEDETATLTHTASGPGDYGSVSSWNEPAVSVRAVDDETPGVVLSPPSLEIEEGGTGTYGVVLSAPPASGSATVSISASGAAGLTVDAASLTFSGTTWETAQTVTVTAVADHARLEDAAGVLSHAVTGYGSVAAGPDLGVSVRNATVDHDPDGDGLLDVDSLAKLNAMRWDLDGDGDPSSGNEAAYAEAFPTPRGGSGVCPTATSGVACVGYELASDLDFDTDGDGATHRSGNSDGGDDYHNDGAGWTPIGNAPGTPFTARFNGDGRVLRNLFVSGGSTDYRGLFGVVTGRIEAVGLPGAWVRGRHGAGALAGFANDSARVTASWSTGKVSGDGAAGGLVGETRAGTRIAASYSTAAVECRGASLGNRGGGLAGGGSGAMSVSTSWAAGLVSGGCVDKGGLVGGPVSAEASYWNYFTTGVPDDVDGGEAPEGLHTSRLQSPTGYSGIYQTWNADLDGDYEADDPWDFGTSRQYPSLKWRGFDPTGQFASPPPAVVEPPPPVVVDPPPPVVVDPPPPVVVDPPPPVVSDPPVNRAPNVLRGIDDLDLDVGETARVSLEGVFGDAENPQNLSYRAASSNPAVASARASGSLVLVEGLAPGRSTVTVTATDPQGLSASTAFAASVSRVGLVLSFEDAEAGATEGGTLRLRLALSRAADSPVPFAWRAVNDGDPSTADADADDLARLEGEGTVPAGETEAFIEVGVLDDGDVEPARERLLVELLPPPEGAEHTLGSSSMRVTVREGVCDRSPAVRDALRGLGACWLPTPDDLARRADLRLNGAGVATLRQRDFAGLSGLRDLRLQGNRLTALPPGLLADLGSLQRLRLDSNLLRALPAGLLAGTPRLSRLDLSGNRIEALPAGLFAGVSELSELDLSGNPGAPFVLTLNLARTDAEPWAPGPALVSARVAEGAPFDLRAPLTAEGAGKPPEALLVSAGEVAGPEVEVRSAGGAVRLSVTAPSLPAGLCDGAQEEPRSCFRGLELRAGPPLALFRAPPRVAGTVPELSLRADGERALLELAELLAPSSGGEALAYEATSDRPDLLSVRIEGGRLALDANADGAEGTAVVTVTAADPDGQTASLSFAVTVEWVPRGILRSWRLEWLRGLAEADQ